MLADLEAATAQYPNEHKSRHWDRFPEDYQRLIADTAVWKEFRRNGLTAAFDSSALLTETPPALIQNLKIVARYRETYDDLCGLIGSGFVRRHSENEIGEPEHIAVDGLKVTITDLRLIYNAWRLYACLSGRQNDRLVIADIGGGYGGLSAKLKRLYPNATVILFDLPEVNAVQTYYLSQVDPDGRIGGVHDIGDRGLGALLDDGFDYLVLPGWTMHQLPPHTLDLVINTRSMMEMRALVIAEYFRTIHLALRPGGFFYCVNRYTNKAAGERIRIKDFPFDDKWRALISEPCWNQPWIHELIVQRLDKPANIPLRSLLIGLPPTTVSDIGRELRGVVGRLITLIIGDHPSINPGLRWTVRNWKHRAERALVQYVKRNEKLHRVARRILRRPE